LCAGSWLPAALAAQGFEGAAHIGEKEKLTTFFPKNGRARARARGTTTFQQHPNDEFFNEMFDEIFVELLGLYRNRIMNIDLGPHEMMSFLMSFCGI